ncbi:winged helix-turn-helix domain-containing protein [Pseudobacillus sp. 179-B 2D1 NHS]|uniref:winged helix-turn-helix domain-containing protein n=1 Tax=Pseudobacillus sp. 179-B 2D1 NHS TaxID=3374292 RepID=UPI00387943B4
MKSFTIEDLLDREDNWMDREGLDEFQERNAWLEEGIALYKQFIEIDRKEPRYAIMLADLYLQRGRDEKMRRGNYQSAYSILRKSTIYAPNKPDAFYHLSFIMANEERRWEAVLFYGKEALENGLQGVQKLKLLCNMALAYNRVGYPSKAVDYIKKAQELNQSHEHDWFILLYMDKMKKCRNEPILLKSSNGERKAVSKTDYKGIKEQAMDGTCVVLDLSSDEKYFYADHDAIRLERKEAEILGFLMDNQGLSCSKRTIEEAVWLDRQVSSTAVKRYISSLRSKLPRAMSCENIRAVLATAEEGYEWKADIQSYVLR